MRFARDGLPSSPPDPEADRNQQSQADDPQERAEAGPPDEAGDRDEPVVDDEQSILKSVDGILTDEGFEVICVESGIKALDKIEEIHRQGRTIVLVTHDPKQVVNHCTRCIVLDHAKKVFDGDPKVGTEKYLSLV